MNTPRFSPYEVISRAPKKPVSATPLLFVHGAFTAAWCWEDHFLPFFAEAGYAVHALSLSGHGASPGRERLDVFSIDDYVRDVATVAAMLPAPPVLIGHSMGGFVVQRYLENHVAPAAVLCCSVPPQGLLSAALSMLFTKPHLLQDLNGIMSGGQVVMETLRDALFSQPLAMEDLQRFYRLAQPESHRAIWDMSLPALFDAEKIKRTPLLIQGAALDHIIPAVLVEKTASFYGLPAHLFPGMGHGLMLERDWREPAQHLLDWLGEHHG